MTTPSGCKDLGIKTIEFAANTHFLNIFLILRFVNVISSWPSIDNRYPIMLCLHQEWIRYQCLWKLFIYICGFYAKVIWVYFAGNTIEKLSKLNTFQSRKMSISSHCWSDSGFAVLVYREVFTNKISLKQ